MSVGASDDIIAMFKAPEKYRAKFEFSHPYYSDMSHGNNGVFQFKTKKGLKFNVLVSDQMGWEHVSVTIVNKKRCPTWGEMCLIKKMFWSDDETVIQYHPKKSDYRNHHPHCLHLWRPIDQPFPTPPPEFIA